MHATPVKIHKYVNAIEGKQSLVFRTFLRFYGLFTLILETGFLHIFLVSKPLIFVETGFLDAHAIAN
ncbi:hypothetical protein [Microcoleus sp. Pol10D4]|uniref:hypothetical protein n=1 Tax=Microcoleus sp. Pol10D4 TaxID=3055387 RepID=UPI002FCF7D72